MDQPPSDRSQPEADEQQDERSQDPAPHREPRRPAGIGMDFRRVLGRPIRPIDIGPLLDLPGQVKVEGVVYIPAGLWRRLGAFLIDAAFLMIMHQVMLAIIGFEGPGLEQLTGWLNSALSDIARTGTPSAGLIADYQELMRPMYIAGWLNVLVCAAYFTVFHGLAGATLGKLALGLKVLRRDGSRLGLGWAFLRYLGYLIVARLAYTAWLVPFNAEQRTLYDMLLATNVMRVAPWHQPASSQTGPAA